MFFYHFLYIFLNVFERFKNIVIDDFRHSAGIASFNAKISTDSGIN